MKDSGDWEDRVTVLKDLKERFDPDTYRDLVRSVFLNLGPVSLKRARQVCKEWDELVMKEVWGSVEGRKELERKLDEQWRRAQPTRSEILLGPGYCVFGVSCDETHITAIITDNNHNEVGRGEWHILLYRMMDLSQVYDHTINQNPHDRPWCYISSVLCFGMGRNVVVAILVERI